jgi:subtilase family serine protease
MLRSQRLWLLLMIGSVLSGGSAAQDRDSFLSIHSRDRIMRSIDDGDRIVLRGDRHPMAIAQNDVGGVPSDFRMDRMVLVLKPDPQQQRALDEFVAQQHDPESPFYHEWLTPEDFGDRFGVSENDLEQIVTWLESHGLRVDEIAPSRRMLVFSGAAADVESTFRAPIRAYRVGGEIHHANAREPEIPRSLGGVVGGVLSLHDFRSQPMHVAQTSVSPEFTAGSWHYLTPSDFSTIYHLNPLYQKGINGSDRTIAIVGRSNFKVADVRQFRSSFGLPAKDPLVVLNGPNPGVLNSNEEAEALLDVEWSGAVARNATIKFVVSASTASSDGVYLSSQYVVNHNLAAVMSVSFGLCEAALGTSGNNFINSLWQQAAAQGITVLVSSGDSGAAGCDSPSATQAKKGRGVNGLCSSPYSVCVGGTQFNDVADPGRYWSTSNAPGTQASALGYIPEQAWNESASSGLWATGGGPSSVYAKPSWQTGRGVPTDGKRDTPDVSFSAAGHDGYFVTMHGGTTILSGTSAAAPAWAGLMALIVQSTATRQGNANHTFYSLAARQQAGSAVVFHDTTNGSNSVPGTTGFNTTPGYDLATGLGSVDANALVTHWNDARTVATFQLSSGTTLALAKNSTGTLKFSTTASGGFNAPIAVTVSGVPAGVTATLSPKTFSAPGSGASTLTLVRAAGGVAGTYKLTLQASGGGVVKSVQVNLTLK